MRARTRRRLLFAGLFVVACALVSTWVAVRKEALVATDAPTGWLLIALVLVLAAYGVRKWLPFLPWGRSQTWLRVHLLIGALALFVFGVHIEWSFPGGPFEFLLAFVFVVLGLSGIFGLWLSRTIPARLTAVGGEVIFERIPALRRELRSESEKIVRASVGKTRSMAIADFYDKRLRRVFDRPRDVWAHLLGGEGPWRRLQDDLDEFESCLSGEGRAVLADLRAHAEMIHRLDVHRALQGALKLWLFVHVPLTWGLMGLAIVHVVIVHAFGAV